MDNFLTNQSLCSQLSHLTHTHTDYHLAQSTSDDHSLPTSRILSCSTPRVDNHSLERQLFFDRLFGKKSAATKTAGENHRQTKISPPQPKTTHSHPWLLGDMRPRVASVPTKPNVRSGATTAPPCKPGATNNGLNQHPLRKVRSFAIIGNRLVKESDAYVVHPLIEGASCKPRMGRNDYQAQAVGGFRSSSGSSEGSDISLSPGCGSCALGSVRNAERHRVVVTGREGVGKSTIVARFLKSVWSTGEGTFEADDCSIAGGGSLIQGIARHLIL